MTRIFRLTSLIKLFADKYKKYEDGVYTKITRLISQIAIIMPIVLKLLPLYMISLYALGIFGMQIFR